MPLSVSKGNVKGHRLHAFLRMDGGEFALKPLNLTRPFARRLPFLFNLILMPLDQPTATGGHLLHLSR